MTKLVEISKDAWEIADSFDVGRTERGKIAAALQKLMGERDRWYADAVAEYQVQMQRAEAAERARDDQAKQCVQLVHEVAAAEARAEAAEKERDEARRWWALLRSETAEARLAECVREVREWYYDTAGTSHIEAVLDKYKSSATPERPEQPAKPDEADDRFWESVRRSAETIRKLPGWTSAGVVGNNRPEHPDTVRLRTLLSDLEDLYADPHSCIEDLQPLIRKYTTEGGAT